MKAHLLYEVRVKCESWLCATGRAFYSIPSTDVYIPVEIRWCSINKCCPTDERTIRYSVMMDRILFACHCCHDMMKLISRAIDALIQDSRIEIFVTLWDLLNTLYSSDSGFFSFIFIQFFVLFFRQLSHLDYQKCRCHYTSGHSYKNLLNAVFWYSIFSI